MSNLFPQLIDSFGRKHDYLRISLTERCNLRCFYCMPEDGVPLRDKSHFMTYEEIIDFANIFAKMGVRKVRLTGGEPFVRKNIDKIILELGKIFEVVRITTNGILIDKYIDVLKRAGITHINLSLDSLKKERFHKISRRDYYDRIMQNISLLLKESFSLKVNMVVMKGINEDEIIDFIKWTKKHPIHVRFIEFMPFNGNRWEWKKIIPYQELLQKVERAFGPSRIVPVKGTPNDTAVNYQIKGYRGAYGFINSVTKPFCSTCNRIRLTADGKLKNCLFSKSETDILSPFRNGEDIIPLIYDNVLHKKAMRGGMETDHQMRNQKRHQANRSMVSIGG